MAEQIAANVARLEKKTHAWTQHLLPLHDGNRLDISSTILCRSIPHDAPDQPIAFPKRSCYRFDTKYYGPESRIDIINMLLNLHSHPGCSLIMRRPGKPSSQRYFSETFSCAKCYAQAPVSNSFGTGKAQANIKRQSIKQTKSSGTAKVSTDAMLSKKERQLIQTAKHSNNLKKSLHRRRDSARNSKEETCKMSFTIFLNRADKFYYLSMVGNLQHSFHAPLPMKAIPQNTNALDAHSIGLVHTLFNTNIPSSGVSRVMEEIHGKDDTNFSPMMLYNLRQKHLLSKDTPAGVTTNMSDPEKTQFKLDE
jgi:hypothetical protein